MTLTESKIYTIICEGNLTNISEIAEAVDKSTTAVKRAIAKLVEKGYIKRIGADRSGKWVPVIMS